jgi:hypothetical protein
LIEIGKHNIELISEEEASWRIEIFEASLFIYAFQSFGDC